MHEILSNMFNMFRIWMQEKHQKNTWDGFWNVELIMFDACFGLLWEPALCQDVNYAHLLDHLKHLVLYNRNYAFAACRPNKKSYQNCSFIF